MIVLTLIAKLDMLFEELLWVGNPCRPLSRIKFFLKIEHFLDHKTFLHWNFHFLTDDSYQIILPIYTLFASDFSYHLFLFLLVIRTCNLSQKLVEEIRNLKEENNRWWRLWTRLGVVVGKMIDHHIIIQPLNGNENLEIIRDGTLHFFHFLLAGGCWLFSSHDHHLSYRNTKL